MDIKSINFRNVAEISAVGLLTICTYYTAKAGISFGTTPWLPLPAFNYADYGLSASEALAWDNMLMASLVLMLLVAYLSDWICRGYIWAEYHTQLAPTSHKQPWFRAIHSAVGVAFLTFGGAHFQSVIPDPASLIPTSVFFDGVLLRAIGLLSVFLGLRYIPYLFVREYCRVTGKLVTD